MRSLILVLAATFVLLVTADAQVGANRAGKLRQKFPPAGRRWQIASQLPASLKLALGAAGKLRYAGTRVLETKSGPNRARHTEYVITSGGFSRIEFPADSPLHGQVIVETPTERRHFIPARNELQILPPQRDQAFERLAKMVANRGIQVTEIPGGAVAGLQSALVSIADRQGNVIQRLWIESRTGMILKRELYDRTGALQGAFEFTDVNLNPIIHDSDFGKPKGVRIVTPDTMLDQIIRRRGYADVRIPAGGLYHLEGARVQKIAQQEVLVQQYSGAGHRITLYQLKTPVDPNRLGKLERPDLQIYSWQVKGISFVLVGDLSDTELRDLGRRLGG